ncbi:MAG TPA: N-acetyltransferase [Chloroflexi bacterium]|nr:N-acetyltransferase [Chloroflexota bacterium]
MDFSIREATREDYERLCELFAEGDTLHREALPHVFREPDGPARTKEFISGIIANEDAVLFVAERDGEIIGLVYILVRETPDIPIMVPRRYAVIDDLIVRKDSRRFGVGRALVERAHRWAVDKQVTQVELNVWEFNQTAIAFYEKLGYRTASRKMWRSLS